MIGEGSYRRLLDLQELELESPAQLVATLGTEVVQFQMQIGQCLQYSPFKHESLSQEVAEEACPEWVLTGV